MKKWRFAIKLLLGLIVIPGMIALSFVQLEKSGFFNVNRIDIIVDDTPQAPQYLQSWMKELDKQLEQFRGISIWKLDLQQIADRVSAEKWVEAVSISRKFPAQLKIHLKPKNVESLLLTRSGKVFPVVSDGTLLGFVDQRVAPDVPLMVGDNLEKNLELRKKSVEALREIPEQGAFSRTSISEIRFDAKEGFWMTLVKSGIKVKMGEDHISLKSDRVSQVIDYMSAQSLDARVIDANLSKKVLVRLRKDP